MSKEQVIQKLSNQCDTLRDDGVSYFEYLSQLTFLLFLKMADERTKPPYSEPSIIPVDFCWDSLINREGDDLLSHYRHTLEELGKKRGLLGLIFGRGQSKFSDPAKLKRVIVDLGQEDWSSLSSDVKGDAYEALLENSVGDVKSAAGQYFTPRPLIKAIIEVMKPEPGELICDPACGTGGFLMLTHEYIIRKYSNMTRQEKIKLKSECLRGVELVHDTARLCTMNMMLHGLGTNEKPTIEAGKDSLLADTGDRFDLVLANPPFGKKSTTVFFGQDGERKSEKEIIQRQDFWASSSNKQLNFVQHIKTILKMNGRAAVVVPDNVLFEGGPGETVRRKLLSELDVHTLLRLPTGIFYKPGVKTNVLFFDKKPAQSDPWTKRIWIYDLRTNKHFTLKTKTLKSSDLEEFVECYKIHNRHLRQETWSDQNQDGRWRSFTYEEINDRDKFSLDIFWLKDESLMDYENLPDPSFLASEIVDDLEAAIEQMNSIAEDLNKRLETING